MISFPSTHSLTHSLTHCSAFHSFSCTVCSFSSDDGLVHIQGRLFSRSPLDTEVEESARGGGFNLVLSISAVKSPPSMDMLSSSLRSTSRKIVRMQAVSLGDTHALLLSGIYSISSMPRPLLAMLLSHPCHSLHQQMMGVCTLSVTLIPLVPIFSVIPRCHSL